MGILILRIPLSDYLSLLQLWEFIIMEFEPLVRQRKINKRLIGFFHYSFIFPYFVRLLQPLFILLSHSKWKVLPY